MADDHPPLILHARIVSGTGGGPEKTILTSPRYLTPFGYQTLCAYYHPPGDPGFEAVRCRARELDAPLVGIPDRGPWDLSIIWKTLALCRRHKVVIWHGHDYKSNLLGLILRRFRPLKLISTAHGWGCQGGRTPWYYKIDRLCLRKYERVICVSGNLFDQCIASGVAAERCVLIENGIETDRYRRRQSPGDVKASLGFKPERLLIGAVGRLSAEKDFPTLIRAIDRIVRSGLDAELAIVGDGDQRIELETLVSQLGLADRVRLLGHRTDLVELYEAMDVYALTSLREGLPNVLLEALAMEVPVIATRIAGIPKVIDHQCNGLLIEPGDLDGLVASLRRLLEDGQCRKRLASAGRRTIEERYSFAGRMAKVRALYDELLGRAGEKRPASSNEDVRDGQ